MRLACLGGAYSVDPLVRATVAERFPAIRVDWEAVDRALAEGPPHEKTQTAAGVPNDRLDWLELERRLHYWAAMIESRDAEDAQRLRAAAALFASWRRAKPYFPSAEPPAGWDAALAETAETRPHGSDI